MGANILVNMLFNPIKDTIFDFFKDIENNNTLIGLSKGIIGNLDR